MAQDPLGDRLKKYEEVETSAKFLPGVPLYARVDGRCFSKVTKGLQRPFDETFRSIMVSVAKALVQETGALVAYVQSDEISLGWHHPELDSEVWFGGRKFKMLSVLAAVATAVFNAKAQGTLELQVTKLPPVFDARVFQVPNLFELYSCFLWRQKDCLKNAVSMAASCHFSHKELKNVSNKEKQEMLFRKGINFNDYPVAFKSGTFVKRFLRQVELTSEELQRIPERRRPKDRKVIRSYYEEFYIPKLSGQESPMFELFM